MRALIEKAKSFVEKYERFLSPGALLFGFGFDNLTLTRIDLLYDNLVLFGYLVVAGFSIASVQLYKSEVFKGVFIDKVAPWLPLAIQFAFGGLFSGYFIFYSRSGSLSASWIFILALLTLLVGNEFFRKYYTRFVFQMSIYYLAIFSFTIFFIPVVLKEMGARIFILSGILSVVVISALFFFFKKVAPIDMRRQGRAFAISIGSIYLAMNIFYFTNIIPPIPLSLKDIGVYHFVERTVAGDYEVITEKRNWYEVADRLSNTIHLAARESVYVYSAVFAPTELNTDILHRWQYYDTSKGKWATSGEIQFPIIGGRDGGYRGYSFKENIFPGKWRVDVVTARGQMLGRVSFKIKGVEDTPTLRTEIK